MASIAVGNAGVSTGLDGLPGRYAGAAPDARLAVYKACWSAPDPADDGCATADLVTAVDHAVQDGVDVLNLSVRGAPDTGAVERALLGAAEAGVVVVAAAGNDAAAYADSLGALGDDGRCAGRHRRRRQRHAAGRPGAHRRDDRAAGGPGTAGARPRRRGTRLDPRRGPHLRPRLARRRPHGRHASCCASAGRSAGS